MSDDISIAEPVAGVETESNAEAAAPIHETGADDNDAQLDALSKEIAAGNVSEDEPTEEPEQEALDSEDSTDHDAEDSEEALEDELLAEDEVVEAKPKLSVNFAGTEFEYNEGDMPEGMAEKLQETVKGFEASQTRKSQALADDRKIVEEAKASVEKIQALDGQALQLFTSGQQLKQNIEKIERLDLQALWQSNPDQARQLSDKLATDKSQLAQVIQETNRIETASSEAQKVELNRVMDAGRQEVIKLSPDFMKREPEITKYAMENYGITEEQAKTWPLNPAGAIMAEKAMLYDQMKDRVKAKKSAKAPKLPTPTKAIKGSRSTGTTNPANMSDEQMAKHLGLPS